MTVKSMFARWFGRDYAPHDCIRLKHIYAGFDSGAWAGWPCIFIQVGSHSDTFSNDSKEAVFSGLLPHECVTYMVRDLPAELNRRWRLIDRVKIIGDTDPLTCNGLVALCECLSASRAVKVVTSGRYPLTAIPRNIQICIIPKPPQLPAVTEQYALETYRRNAAILTKPRADSMRRRCETVFRVQAAVDLLWIEDYIRDYPLKSAQAWLAPLNADLFDPCKKFCFEHCLRLMEAL